MNKPVQVTLGEPFGTFVDNEVESGRFSSAEKFVEASVHLLEEEQMKMERLRELLIESENDGPAEPYDHEALMTSDRASWAERV